jgi:hypothetical protein
MTNNKKPFYFKYLQELMSISPQKKLQWLESKPYSEQMSDEEWLGNCYEWEFSSYGYIRETQYDHKKLRNL